MVKYYTPSREAIARQQQQVTESVKSRYAGGTEVELEKGQTIWRLLPTWKENGPFSRVKAMWFKKTLGWSSIKEGALPIITEVWPGEEDPIMNALLKISSVADVSDKLSYTLRFLVNALILQRTDAGSNAPVRFPDWSSPKVLKIPKTVNDWIGNRYATTKVDVSDPYKGWWLETIRSGSGKGDTKYDTNLAMDFEEARALTQNDDALEQILNGIQDLDKFVGKLDDEMMAKQQEVARELLNMYGISSGIKSSPSGIKPQHNVSAPFSSPMPSSMPPVQFPGMPQAQAPVMPPAQAPIMPPAQAMVNPQVPAAVMPQAQAPVNPPAQAMAAPTAQATVSNPGQVSGGTKPCFAGLADGNMFLNSLECTVCPQETECLSISTKKGQGQTVASAEPVAAPVPVATPSASPALAPCFGNLSSGKPAAAGYSCESCMFATPCKFVGAK